MKLPRDNKGAWSHHFLGRRDLLKVGTLGYLGLNLRDYFQLSNVMASGLNSEPKAKSKSEAKSKPGATGQAGRPACQP